MVSLTSERTLVGLLRRRRDVERGVLVEKVDRLERHPDDLAGHDRKVFNAWYLQIESVTTCQGG